MGRVLPGVERDVREEGGNILMDGHIRDAFIRICFLSGEYDGEAVSDRLPKALFIIIRRIGRVEGVYSLLAP